MNATLVICLVNRPHDNSFQERGSCFKGRRRYWNIVRTLNCSLPNDDHNLLTLIGSLSKDVFERRTSTGSEAFSLFIRLDTTKFVLLSFFSPIKTIYLRVSTKPQPNAAKSPLPVDVRRSKTLLLKLPNVTRNGTGNEKTHEKWKPKSEIHYPFLVLFQFFLFSTTRARFPFPDPRSPFLVICEIILLLNTEAEPWEYKNYPGNIIVAGMARRKSLQTPLNVKGSRITLILGTAEPLTHKRYKNGPWIQDPARVLMAIFWGQRERSSTSPPNGRANTPLIFVRKSVPGVN